MMAGTAQIPRTVDELPLSDSYIPERLVARESQIAEINRCLAPAAQRRKPIHLWLHGKAGSGKTVTVRHVLNQLQERSGIGNALVNCWEKASFFEILDALISHLRVFRAEEHRTSLKLEKLRGSLKDQPFIVVLDEVDRLRPAERSATLYNLGTLGNLGLVCISNSPQALAQLEERVRSRLNPYPICFPRYSGKEILEILRHRAEQAFGIGACSDGLLRRIVAVADGDARVAIRALRTAMALAEQDGTGAISLRSLRRQWKAAKDAKRAGLLEGLTEDHRILYRITKGRGHLLSTQLWQEYLRRCERFGRRPIAARTFSNYANQLVQAGLATSERARVKGQVRLFKITE